MDYSVRPTRSELEKVKSIIDQAINQYSYTLEVEDPEILLSWQRHENDFSVLEVTDSQIMVAVNPDSEDYSNTDIDILRALLEIEFIEKAEFNEINFKWQEVAKYAYVGIRSNEIAQTGLEIEEQLENRWPHIRDQLGQRVSEYDEFFYMNTLVIGEAIGKQLSQDYSAEELVKLSKSDISKAGEEAFE